MIDYLRAQKVIHWLMAIVIMLDLNVAQKFGGDMELWDRLESRVDHATAGLIVTFLFILRIFLTSIDAWLAGLYGKDWPLWLVFFDGAVNRFWNCFCEFHK